MTFVRVCFYIIHTVGYTSTSSVTANGYSSFIIHTSSFIPMSMVFLWQEDACSMTIVGGFLQIAYCLLPIAQVGC
jgi:hypothetical protein